MVRQVRVRRNVLALLLLCAGGLWLLRAHLETHPDALFLGLSSGALYGVGRWWALRRRIARRNRRFERNKIFVHALTWGEGLLAAVAYNPLLLLPLGGLGAAGLLLALRAASWGAIAAASFGLAAMGVLAGCVIGYEKRHGPLYYQYRSEAWSGAEGLLYQEGRVVEPLLPAGKVSLQGALWNAVSLSGEPIAAGERVEVLAVERLTLYVDRLPPEENNA
ncbi:MAG: hypothetical protein KatS3mg131_3735 [Candidatus Tectimicrobiota bacterium]|nr:MAG: hypothetical protein KatS3mg131_3735 [Candidatus Tectomicrobia bacterium]